MLRFTGCNTVILMAATAWLMLSFSSCIVCGFDSYTVLFKCPQRKFSLPRGGRENFHESNPHTIQELKDNISHAVTAISITVLHRVYRNMIRRAQLCIDAEGNHLQHRLWWHIFQHLATVLISVFTLRYGPGLLFRGPLCVTLHWRIKTIKFSYIEFSRSNSSFFCINEKTRHCQETKWIFVASL